MKNDLKSLPSEDFSKQKHFEISGENMNLANLFWASQENTQFSLSQSARQRLQKNRAHIEKKLSRGEIIYGVNTGFGAFSSVAISAEQIEKLQVQLVRSHSSGVGPSFSRQEIRAILILRANTLARAHSGVRVEVLDQILAFLNAGICPVIPQMGSVGASGDLAPLSHLALGLIGEGDCLLPENNFINSYGARSSVASELQKKGLKPLQLQAKEGLSLINGCQVMTAIGMLGAYRLQQLLHHADLAGAMTLEALKGSRKAFHPRISEVRPHPGEIATAANLRSILEDKSEISESHRDCKKVQDAYSLRCMPAVHGAVRNALAYAENVLVTEANSSTDNPLVFDEIDEILSCGNFHGMPVAVAMDHLTAVTSSLANISEQRIAKLMNPVFSELPAFLAPDGGLNSGFMIVHVAAASLVSESKALAHPASVDSIPTSTDKEDHVSMGTIAARKFKAVVELAEKVIAMELLAASQALEFHRPLRSSKKIEEAHGRIRERVPFAKEDRVFSQDIEKVIATFFPYHSGGFQ